VAGASPVRWLERAEFGGQLRDAHFRP